jgi:dynactin complex subunit
MVMHKSAGVQLTLQSGLLRYCGKTLFASGMWAGIELDEAAGKNNGSIDGVPYFHCPPNYGMRYENFLLWCI